MKYIFIWNMYTYEICIHMKYVYIWNMYTYEICIHMKYVYIWNMYTCEICIHMKYVYTRNMYTYPARGGVGRVTDCGVRGLGFKSPGSILTYWTETSSLSRVVRYGGDPCSVPVSGLKKSLLRWSLRLGRWTATTIQKKKLILIKL